MHANEERACAERNRKVTANFGEDEDDEYFANGSQIWDGGGGSTLRTVRKIWEEDEEERVPPAGYSAASPEPFGAHIVHDMSCHVSHLVSVCGTGGHV